ncbi:hypothetical protein CVT26_013286 [Gymnopilus dilepis]|uniref:Uncharacterized protein n=1 Tax=Gymnopilus dilepis TaxID=231916 RepID=A0A409VUR8_9AGAR|nr:hypothetical protein CVT26_013286 [Gymnopilus dilepis]
MLSISTTRISLSRKDDFVVACSSEPIRRRQVQFRLLERSKEHMASQNDHTIQDTRDNYAIGRSYRRSGV